MSVDDIVKSVAKGLPDYMRVLPKRQVFLRVVASAIVGPSKDGNPNVVGIYDYQKDLGAFLNAGHNLEILQIIPNEAGYILRCRVISK